MERSIIMIFVTTASKRQKKNFRFLLVLFYMVIFSCDFSRNFGVLCQLDSNINTLRYDGEVNIGKKFFEIFYYIN